MSDIFISYASEDRNRAQSLAQALERKGWSVWWDQRIPTGRSFDQTIQEAVEGSKAVVVAWTKASVKSQWVKNEARKGLKRGILFQVMLLEEVEIPLEFEHLQSVQLMDWRPDQDHAGFDQFVEDLVRAIGTPSQSGAQQPSVTQVQEPTPLPTGVIAGMESSQDCADEEKAARRPFEQKLSTETSCFEILDAPEVSRDDQRAVRKGEDRPRASTRPVRSAQSTPYLIIGAVLLVIIGAFLWQWILLPISFLIPENSSLFLRTVEFLHSQSPGISPAPGLVPMVLVPAGEFMMGSRQDDKMANKDERPAHPVYLDAFYIDQYEVTTARYVKFFQETKRPAPKYWSEQVLKQHGRKPVAGADWNEAAAYCFWVGKRLPTEAEWEKAARGTDQRLYPWGNVEPSQQRVNFDHCCNFNEYGVLTDVGSFEGGQSPYGAYDMAGNVWEWVADWYDGGYYGKSPERNPAGPSNGEKRVLRGGAWDSAPDYVRSEDRLRLSPTFRLDNIGFRCAQDAPQ